MQNFVTSTTSEMREKILNIQISPSRTANHRFVHFPMNSNGKRKNAEPFHWTLLVLDKKEGDWLHYNSFRPRLAETVDHYFEDARILVCLIDTIIKYILLPVTVITHPLTLLFSLHSAETICGELQLCKY